MNSNKKSTLPQPFNRRAAPALQLKPFVVQPKPGMPAQSGKRPVAPPVYRPTTAANAAQPKMANCVVNRKLPVAPPVYRPEAKKIVQPKPISQQAKIANSIRPISAKTTALSFRAVQMAEAKKKAHECSAKVVASSGDD